MRKASDHCEPVSTVVTLKTEKFSNKDFKSNALFSTVKNHTLISFSFDSAQIYTVVIGRLFLQQLSPPLQVILHCNHPGRCIQRSHLVNHLLQVQPQQLGSPHTLHLFLLDLRIAQVPNQADINLYSMVNIAKEIKSALLKDAQIIFVRAW